MTFCEGNSRTILRLRFASAIDFARLPGLRYLSSFTVSTPAACKSPAYSLLMPLMRMRSATLAPQELFFADLGLDRQQLAAFDGAGGFQQCAGRTDAHRFENRHRVVVDPFNVGYGVGHP